MVEIRLFDLGESASAERIQKRRFDFFGSYKRSRPIRYSGDMTAEPPRPIPVRSASSKSSCAESTSWIVGWACSAGGASLLGPRDRVFARLSSLPP